MKNFRFIYGFLILAILVIGLYITNIATIIADNNNIYTSNSEETVITGLPEPRGKFTLSEIIEAYGLDKADFYEALHIPMDFPDDKKVSTLVRYGKLSYKDISEYMEPIIEDIKNK